MFPVFSCARALENRCGENVPYCLEPDGAVPDVILHLQTDVTNGGRDVTATIYVTSGHVRAGRRALGNQGIGNKTAEDVASIMKF